MIKDYIKIGISNLTKRKLRTWLTMIGIFIGIALVVYIIGMGQGLQNYIDYSFDQMGRDKIMLAPKGGFGPGSETEVKLTDKDLKVIDQTRGVAKVAGMMVRIGELTYREQTRYNYLAGMPLDKDQTELIDELFLGFDIEQGRALQDGDKYKVVLGHYYLDRDIFKPNLKLRDKVLINGVEFKVVGFYEIIGNPADDQNIYIPIDTMKELLDIDEVAYDQVIAKTEAGLSPSEVADRIKKNLRSSRDVKEGEEDFTVQSTEDLLESFNTILLVVQVVLGGLAFISLFVGGIGIMNTMFTAVLERTKEIGIMKAIGARNSDIMILFLIESGILGLAGGLVGAGIGIGAAKLTEYILVNFVQITFLQVFFPWYMIVGTLAFSFIAGTLSGIIPARRASRMNPVDSLRYE